MTIQNDIILKTLARQPTARTPIWIMRQAGRYLPEYREIRANVPDFLALCKTPELACQVTLQPLDRFPLDAAILFSDILIIPHAMGMELAYLKNEGPVFNNPIRHSNDLKQLKTPDPESDMPYTQEAIRLIKQGLNNKVPLIGFTGSPWTNATYMVEGRGSKTFSTIKAMLYQQPKLLHTLLSRLSDATVHSLNAQIDAGVDIIMLFDTWGSVLTTEAYQEFSLYYMQNTLEQVKLYQSKHYPERALIPTILFTKGGGLWLEKIAATGCNAVGLDWTIDIKQARQRIGDKVVLQGNLDPCVLYAEPERIESEVQNILQSYGPGSGHIFNLGHGIYPDIPVEHVQALVEAVHRHSPQYHALDLSLQA